MSDTAAPLPRPRGRPGHDREEVLRRSVGLFNRQGYDATSMADLAKELGVTKSALYHHFNSKESLLSAALDEALDGLTRAVEDAVAATSGESAYTRLRATVSSSVLILVDHLPAVTLLLRVRGNSPLEQSALERRRSIDERLSQLVREAVAEGSLRDDIDPELVSRFIFGMVNSLVDWYRPGGSLSVESLAATVTSALFDGLQGAD
jgi:AcrR family transcriptional regulator